MKEFKDFISAGEAADQLGWKYHTFLSWIKRDKCSVKTNNLVQKLGWGWVVKKEVVDLFKEEKG